MTYENPTPDEITEIYTLDAPVVIGDATMSLGQALQAEALFCPKAGEQDQAKRSSWLAGALAAAGTLNPDHQHLVRNRQE